MPRTNASAKCFACFHHRYTEIFVKPFLGSGNKDSAMGSARPVLGRFASVVVVVVVVRSERLARTPGGGADRYHAVVADLARFENHAAVHNGRKCRRAM